MKAGTRELVLSILDQLRKRRLVVCYTTHTGAKVDRRLRELTEEVRWMTNWSTFGVFTYKAISGVEGPNREMIGRGFVRRRAVIDNAYDSWGLVRADGLGGVEGEDASAASGRAFTRFLLAATQQWRRVDR